MFARGQRRLVPRPQTGKGGGGFGIGCWNDAGYRRSGFGGRIRKAYLAEESLAARSLSRGSPSPTTVRRWKTEILSLSLYLEEDPVSDLRPRPS